MKFYLTTFFIIIFIGLQSTADEIRSKGDFNLTCMGSNGPFLNGSATTANFLSKNDEVIITLQSWEGQLLVRELGAPIQNIKSVVLKMNRDVCQVDYDLEYEKVIKSLNCMSFSGNGPPRPMEVFVTREQGSPIAFVQSDYKITLSYLAVQYPGVSSWTHSVEANVKPNSQADDKNGQRYFLTFKGNNMECF